MPSAWIIEQLDVIEDVCPGIITASNFAKDLGNDLYAALNGPFSNLEEIESDEAWATLAEVIKSSGSQEPEQFLLFRKTIAERLEKNAKIEGNWKPLQH